MSTDTANGQKQAQEKEKSYRFSNKRMYEK
jgi:hypothetical protein